MHLRAGPDARAGGCDGVTAYAAREGWEVRCADCLDVLRGMDECSVDMLATDPPYALIPGGHGSGKQASGGFMGCAWDKALPDPAIWRECLRVLKPGGAACVMSGARLDCLWRVCRDLDDAGFELSQSCFTWVYRSGFPKGGDLSKMADHRAGAEREVVMTRTDGRYAYDFSPAAQRSGGIMGNPGKTTKQGGILTAPATPLAVALDGQFTRGKLKPAMEFIIWARKPISEATELDNVVRWGTGSVNCGKCMVPRAEDDRTEYGVDGDEGPVIATIYGDRDRVAYHAKTGRFPANVLCMDDALGSGSRYFDIDAWAAEHGIAEDGWADAAAAGMIQIPKPSRAEKNQGCEGLPEGPAPQTAMSNAAPGRELPLGRPRSNAHPSVKPVRLFSYLIHLLCPSGGLVLDPFCGSGTTGVAAVQAGYQFVGIDMEQEYCEIARARIEHAAATPMQLAMEGT